MIKLIVAGSRGFDNYDFMCYYLDKCLQNLDLSQVTIISGGARGADELGERYARERGLNVLVMPAEWNKYGRGAGYIRNEEMAKIATHCVVFWDGQSRGAEHMIKTARKYALHLRYIDCEVPFIPQL